MGWKATCLLLCLVLLAVSLFAQQPVAIGNEFHINTYTTDGQYSPSVASLPDGGFVVVWSSAGSYGTDTDGGSIQGQRYNPGGIPVGGEFQVNSFSSYYQFIPDIGVDAAGNFVVVWVGPNPFDLGEDFADIFGQRFAADGSSVGDEFQVNSYTSGRQDRVAVAVAPDGSFIVAWDSPSLTEHRSGIRAQRFAADATPLAGEFQVNTYTTDKQRFPSIAIDADGDFVVVWESDGSAGTDTGFESKSVQGQRFAFNGALLGGEFQVNTYTTGNQYKASVAMDTDGDFVVVWRSLGPRGQRFAADGTPLGSEFQVSSLTTSGDSPDVAMASAGAFVVVWTGVSSGTDNTESIQVRRFASDGMAIGEDFQVNTYTPAQQWNAAVSVDPGSDFVVTWESRGDDPTYLNRFGIRGQRFYDDLIFGSGFEFGDTSDWSSITP